MDIQPKSGREETCKWLFTNVDYVTWLRQGHGMFWIRGNPGAGKSVLMKYAAQQLKQQPGFLNSHIIASFFFVKSGYQLQRTAEGLFRSLIHQLLRQSRSLLSHVVPTYTSKRETQGEKWEWRLEELEGILKSTIQDPQALPTYIFVDAIDECQAEEGTSPQEILSFFEKMSSLEGSKLRLCVSSRYFPVLNVQPCPRLSVEVENASDIQTVVRAELQTLYHWKMTETHFEPFERFIARKAEGIFLWARLVLDIASKEIKNGTNPQSILARLEKIPTKLEDLLQDIFNRVIAEVDDLPETITIFVLVAFATRPLTLTELRYALGFSDGHARPSQEEWQTSGEAITDDEQMQRMIRSRSGGLLDVKPYNLSNDVSTRSFGENQQIVVVQFIHQSVGPFLTQKPYNKFFHFHKRWLLPLLTTSWRDVASTTST